MKLGNHIVNATKIICVGTNYMDHIEETGLDVRVSGMPFIRTMNAQNIIDEIVGLYLTTLYKLKFLA